MNHELKENKKSKAEGLTLGVRHNYVNDSPSTLAKKATKLGFSSQEIETMKRLYKIES